MVSPPLFYKHYWEILKKEVIEAVQDFFYTRTLQRQLNYTFIALIPKLEGAALVNQFRPISLAMWSTRSYPKSLPQG